MASGIAETHNSCKIKHPIKSESSDQKNKVEELGTCNPIYTIDELISWKPKDQLCKWRKLVIPKAATTDHKVSGFGFNCQGSRGPQLTRLVGDSTPKTIVCHDYKGGYLEDKFPKGVETDDIYTFFHWSAIDIFIYFSHNIVSIPTLPWLNAAHKHGCKVLGTFITEFAEGEAAWREILKNEENFTAVIENLTEICTFFKFDGYLLNVENVIPAEHVPRLIDFVRLLTEKLHNVSPDFEVIWYDSVIATTGKLDWQNKLCPLNRVFFDLCDGIFLNYCWSESDLVESLSQADVRKHDVYVGVDVFGRGCHGGGGFNSFEAMKLIHKYGLSTAIFASAWTFEKCPDGGDFLSREILFWNSIWPYLFIHGPATLPFTTSFCIGRGKFKFHEGEIFGSEWGCLTYQQYQPSTCYSVGEEKNRKYKTSCLEINKTNSYSGGTCLKIVNKNNEKLELNDKMIRLFTCRFTCPGQIAIDFTYKNDDEKQNPSALVLLVQEKTRIRKVYLANIHFADLLSRNSSTDAYFELRNIQNNSYIEIVDYKLYSTHNDWNSCQFLYDLNGREIIEINFVHLGVGEILLGQLSIQESSHQMT